MTPFDTTNATREELLAEIDLLRRQIAANSGAHRLALADSRQETADAQESTRLARAAERRRAALLDIGDRLRDGSDPVAMSAIAAEAIGLALGVDRVGYGTMSPDGTTVAIEKDWTAPGFQSLIGAYPLNDFGALTAPLALGETVVISDADADERAATARARADTASIKALISHPVVEDGETVAVLSVVAGVPRHWSADEIAFVRDVAERTRGAMERRRAEQSLRDLAASLEQQVEERTRERDRIWHVSQDMLGVSDMKGVWLSINPAWIRVLGWDAENFLGRTTAWLLHPDDQAAAQVVRENLAGGRIVTFVGRYRTRGGDYRLLSWTAVPSEGRTYSVARDITEERQRENALRDMEDFTRLALTSVGGVGVWTLDMVTDTFYCEPPIALLYGLDVDKASAGFRSDEFLANVHPEDRPKIQETTVKGLPGDGDLEMEYRILHPDGSTRWVLSRGHTYNDDTGAPVRRTGVGIETTRQRQLEEQLRQSQKMEAVGQLTGGVAHDFNNLLTVIRSSTDLLKRPGLAEERRTRYIAAISDTVERASKLTGQLLAFARRQALRPEAFDVGRSIRSIGDMVSTLTGARITIVTHVPDEPCFISADPSQFDTAIVNMAINARDAMDGEGTLTITVRSLSTIPAIRAHTPVVGKFVAVSLTDSGSGVPPEQLEQIFEPFFTTKQVGQGTGLGLSQVFGFAKQSGGDVMVVSEVGRGSTFTLFLPRVPEAAESADATEVQPLVDGHGTRVLVVEDNVDVGTFATQTLAELGYKTVWVPEAAKALAELARDPTRFDVVFSDVVMPGMNGIDMAAEIRRLYRDLPVVLTSGYSNVLAEQGTSGFELLHKPYSVEQLSRVLSKAAALRQTSRASLD